MGKLFLSGGDHGNNTKKIDKVFLKSFPKSLRVLFIPIALPEKICSFGARYDWIRDELPGLKIDMWIDISRRSWNELKSYGAVYIAGGNPYLLLKKIRSSKFDTLLHKYYKHHGIIYGSSAGGIILGKDIRSTSYGGDADKNTIRLKKFNGLNLLKNYAVQFHYKPSDSLSLSYCAKKHKINIIAFPDDIGLVVEGKKMKVIGESRAVLFTKSSKVVYIPGRNI